MTRISQLLGIVALLAGSAVPASANLIVNGDFETGDFTGWTQSANATFTFVDGPPHSGPHAAWLGPVNTNGFLSQTLVTVPGHLYDIEFWLQLDSNGIGPVTPNFFSFSWGGSSATLFNNF